jgi:hypothetical protein
MQTDQPSRIPFSKLFAPQVRAINEAMDAINSRRPLPGAGVDTLPTPTGTALSVPALPPRHVSFYGVLVNKGPAGDADFTDSRYWVRSVVFAQAPGSGPTNKVSAYVDWTSDALWGAASHFAEVIPGTHGLSVIPSPTDLTVPVGTGATLVRVSPLPCGAYGFEAVQGGTVFHAIITAATPINGGIRYKYTVQIGHWDMTNSPTTGGTWVADGPSGYAFNSAEDMNTFATGTGAIGTGNTNVTQSDGTINGSACKLVALPVGGYVCVKPRGVDSSGSAYFTIVNFANSAQ